MRWFASLFVLALTMALFHRLTEAGPLEARAALALGFLLLAALLAGDLSRRWRLPRLTGFLLVGFCVGPAWLGLVREDEVAALRFIADAALALLALAAGAELRLEVRRESRVALTRLATGAIGFPFLAVSAVILSVSPWFPLTVHQSFGDGVAVALVLGTLAAAASPAVTVALIGEMGARGPFTRAVLGVTIVQDVAGGLPLAPRLAPGKGGAGPRAPHPPLAIAGAGLRLQVLGELWPWILLLVGLRVSSLRAGWRWAGRHPLVTGDLARYGWRGLVSQAGTVLGLAQIARRAFPEWGVSLEALIVAMIGVHEVVGPLWFRAALVQVGEVTEGEHVAANSHGDGSAVVAARGGL